MATTVSLSRKKYYIKDPVYENVLTTLSDEELTRFLELATFVCACQCSAIVFDTRKRKSVTAGSRLREISGDHLDFLDIQPENELLTIQADEHDHPENVSILSKQDSIRFYAGISITSTKGQRLGTLSVMNGFTPSGFGSEQKKALTTIAHLIACMIDLKVDNSISSQKADSQLQAERKISRLTLAEQDTEKGRLAYQLQENFAQTLAATKLYLEYAELSTENMDHFIQKSRDNIADVITEMNRLCRSMGPALAGNPDMSEVLEDLITEWESQYDIQVDFICRANLEALPGHSSLALFHIVQQQLKMATYCKAKKAEISIVEKDDIHFYFTIRGTDFSDPDPQEEMFITHILSRVAQLNGALSFDKNVVMNDVMRIRIPSFDKIQREENRP
jgi:signal transduction histidine kinase